MLHYWLSTEEQSALKLHRHKTKMNSVDYMQVYMYLYIHICDNNKQRKRGYQPESRGNERGLRADIERGQMEETGEN